MQITFTINSHIPQLSHQPITETGIKTLAKATLFQSVGLLDNYTEDLHDDDFIGLEEIVESNTSSLELLADVINEISQQLIESLIIDPASIIR